MTEEELTLEGFAKKIVEAKEEESAIHRKNSAPIREMAKRLSLGHILSGIRNLPGDSWNSIEHTSKTIDAYETKALKPLAIRISCYHRSYENPFYCLAIENSSYGIDIEFRGEEVKEAHELVRNKISKRTPE